jgi:hypothetical protein
VTPYWTKIGLTASLPHNYDDYYGDDECNGAEAGDNGDENDSDDDVE